MALFLIATHAYFLGEGRGLVVALAGVVILVPLAALEGVPFSGGMLAFYEVLFAVSAICCGLFVARLRTAESAARLRARQLSRRTIEAEALVRRRLAESIHDGPVQELIGLDLILAAAEQAAARDDREHVRERLADARALAERNVDALRDEILSLGPYGFEELTFAAAVEQCVPLWERRYGIRIELAVDPLNLENDTCGALFGVTQEAVANAGKHAGATRVVVTLRTVEGEVELRVSDDGQGFDDGARDRRARDEGRGARAAGRERQRLRSAYSQPRWVATSTAWARSTAPSLA